MNISPQLVFNEFQKQILNESYHPTNFLETLKARLAATGLLQHRNPHVVVQAERFLQKTSIVPKEDLSRLQELASQIKSWDELRVLSMKTHTSGAELEYQLVFTTQNNDQQTLHFHAHYEIKDHRCYFVSQHKPLIRIIGDTVLHQPGILFPHEPRIDEKQELLRQIEQAKSILIRTGGAGIAANQCAALEHPYQFTIVGVFMILLSIWKELRSATL